MNFKAYIPYFHDGGFLGIKNKGNLLELFLRSCEISEDEPIDREYLSKDSAVKGKLCLEGIKSFKVDHEENKEIPWKEFDDGEILTFKIENNKVFLLIEWSNYPPKIRSNSISTIEIEAEKIYWVNIPDLEDGLGYF